MITIKVVACKGQPPVGGPLVAEFDELGGSIGRGENNNLVLPDPERHISRTHAEIIFRAGRYLIRDHGTVMPVQVNGQMVGEGREVPLADGDEIVIGAYTLGVAVQAPAPRATSSAGVTKDDPLAFFGPGPAAANPFADLLPPGSSPVSAGPPAGRFGEPFAQPSERDAGEIIPADFDPFAQQAPSPQPLGSARLGEDFDLGPSTENQSIDQLFGLKDGGSTDRFALEGPLGEAGAGRAGTSDQGRPQRDDTPELYGSFRLPQAKPDQAMAGPERQNLVLSWDEQGSGSGEIKTMIVSSRRREQEAAQSAQVEEKLSSAVQASPTPSRSVGILPSAAHGEPPPQPTPTPQTPPPAAGPGDQGELLHAFLAGAGVAGLSVPGGLSPQTMGMLGKILHEAMQGTLDLLLARAMIKREIRAELTMIVPRENNPLKFSPNVEAALAHLLGPPTRGFMPPLEAMKDAYDDLRAHQFGFMAGMRAALAGVLKRFDPAVLEHRLTQKTMMDSLLPMSRKAKLWDLFAELYGEISREAEDDFQALFGQEFLRAYEAQIAKLDGEQEGNRV